MSWALLKPPVVNECPVCRGQNGKAVQFFYGGYACLACVSFFRRHYNVDPKPCLTGGNCNPEGRKCPSCRLKNIRSAGMIHTQERPALPSPPPTPPGFNMATIISGLKALDICRDTLFRTRVSMENISLDTLISKPLHKQHLVRRTPKMNLDFYDWATMDQISAIDLMKKLEFVGQLNAQTEIPFFIKRNYVKFIILINAVRNLKNAGNVVEYPGGVDVFPDEVKKYYQNNLHLLASVRCKLLARLRELKITNEEFLLLGAIVICDPSNQKLKPASRDLISQYQKMFNNALLQYCLHNYSKNGPTRFTEILGILHLINSSFMEFGNIWLPYLAHEQPNVKQLFTDFSSIVQYN
ncbi:Protein CBG22952 [Caenorhabditis briggsae]|uniref:Uncharacterized protein n=2 Tax=Caenorhabditis briggsae TaxID=6238 RepID=A0AAE9DG59_CAEBR|nr:Protein CBG22952 [Caenorhabditis briggsae]ULU03273.1 hypothetical protein L3Y34_002683 [Caenorhabditis briggsae]UMM25902.1 hypothetical protein L5515_005528 [Caenorhabditis briggsae]CAP39479.1 Protein CBG22952 [Caenorhabditis briggsae]